MKKEKEILTMQSCPKIKNRHSAIKLDLRGFEEFAIPARMANARKSSTDAISTTKIAKQRLSVILLAYFWIVIVTPAPLAKAGLLFDCRTVVVVAE